LQTDANFGRSKPGTEEMQTDVDFGGSKPETEETQTAADTAGTAADHSTLRESSQHLDSYSFF